MKKTACVVACLLLLTGLAASMTTQEIDAFLRNHTEAGYRFIKSTGDNLWYVAFKLPDWKNEWSVAVILVKDDAGNEILSIGTSLARTGAMPSQGLLKYLLEKNTEDQSLGSFSLFYDKEYVVQYLARVPNQFLTTDQLLYYIGFVTAYCDKTQGEVAKFLAK